MREYVVASVLAGGMAMLASTGNAGLLKIDGGVPIVPAANTVVDAPGNIQSAGGPIVHGSNLLTTRSAISLSYFYTGSESRFANTLVVLRDDGSVAGTITDRDDGPGFDNLGVPGVFVASVRQGSAGFARFRFDIDFRNGGATTDASIVNGSSDPGQNIDIGLAYLNKAFQISATPTNRVGIFLDDGLPVDDDHDDWVGYVDAVPIPAALPLLISGLAGLGLFTRRRRT